MVDISFRQVISRVLRVNRRRFEQKEGAKMRHLGTSIQQRQATVTRGGKALGMAAMLFGIAQLAFLLVLSSASTATAVPILDEKQMDEAKFIYYDRCSGCHGALRKGATGPNITAEKMKKKTLEELKETIFEGTDAGMPGWGRTGELTDEQSALMAKFMQLPAPVPPEMGLGDEDDA